VSEALAVTVSITRRVDPSRTSEMVAWVQAGITLAERFPGFLGAGWVRPGPDSDEWHMLARFVDRDALDTWESSPERRWWLQGAQDLVDHQRLERRTGIEGWFDEPASVDAEDLRTPPPAPPRWKQATVIWLTFFPLSLTLGFLLGLVAPDLGLVLRTAITTLAATPIMVYALLPWMTRRFEWWLHGRPLRG